MVSSVLSVLALMVFASSQLVDATLTATFYDKSCPGLTQIVASVIYSASLTDPGIGAKLLRVHFHDCFVQGCDASVLLDDVGSFRGEKNAQPNRNSLKGFDVIDNIKTAVEAACPGIVSCADILAVAASASVFLAGGPSYDALLGRRDSRTASTSLANRDIPAPFSNASQLIQAFQNKGLSVEDLVVLSGGHTIGTSRCSSFTQRLYNQSGNFKPDSTIQPNYLVKLQQTCPRNGNGNVTVPLDFTPSRFDNNYYKNLVQNVGLLNSDQVLTTQSSATASLVKSFVKDEKSFFDKFGKSMIKMGNISPLTGTNGEIRKKCRIKN